MLGDERGWKGGMQGGGKVNGLRGWSVGRY